MSLKKSDPSALARIRDNQRRSRARRREYIEDLETRLQRFEESRVEANVELQKAARKVVRENELLKSLLRSHGVSTNEIQRFLHDHSDHDLSIPRPHGRPKSHVLTSINRNNDAPPRTRESTLSGKDHASEPSSRHADSGEERQLAEDVTSCEIAANIIASMRGNNDEDAARAELGCAPGTRCVVQNMTIFQLMDP